MESLSLRKKYNTLKKAKQHAKRILPHEPMSLVVKYQDGKEPESKASVVSRKYSRFSIPACPVQDDAVKCQCAGKCKTRRCPCRSEAKKCTQSCGCKAAKDCSNK